MVGKAKSMCQRHTFLGGGSGGGGGGGGGEGDSVVCPSLEKSLKIGNFWDILKSP